MYSNFEFLKEENRDLYELGKSIESQVLTAPSAVLTEGTTFLDNILYSISDKENVAFNDVDPFWERCEKLHEGNAITDDFKRYLQKTFNMRNKMHTRMKSTASYLKGNRYRARAMVKRLFQCAIYYYDCLGYKNARKPKYVEIEDLDKPFFEVENCVVCGSATEKGSFFCKKCNKFIQYCKDVDYFAEKFGYYSLFAAEDLSTLGYAKDELDELLPKLARQKLLINANGKYLVNHDELINLRNTVKEFIEVENLFKNFYTEQLSIYQLKESEAYEMGKLFKDPYIHFYNFVDKEMKKLFFEECKGDKTIKEIMDMDLISKDSFIDLVKFNESPLILNKLEKEFIEACRDNKSQDDIIDELCIDLDIYNLLYSKTEDKINESTFKQKIYDDFNNGASFDEVLSKNNISLQEFDIYMEEDEEFKNKIDLIKNKREETLLHALKNKGIKQALKKANLTFDELSEEILTKVDSALKNKFLTFIDDMVPHSTALLACEIDGDLFTKWLEDETFKNKFTDIKAENLLEILYKGQTLEDSLKIADVSIDEFNQLMVNRKEFKNIISDGESLLANQSLKLSFIELKSLNKSEDEIKSTLSITDEVYKYFDTNLSDDIGSIWKKQFINDLNKGNTYDEALKNTGLSSEAIVQFKKADSYFRDTLEDILDSRKLALLEALENNGFESSIRISKLTQAEIDKLFNAKNYDNFYNNVNHRLKEKYLGFIKEGLTTTEALDKCEVSDSWLNNWLADKTFKNELRNSKLNVLLKLLKKDTPIYDALKHTDVSKKEFKKIVLSAFNGNESYEEFLDIYFDKMFPEDFSNFLSEFSESSEKTALKKSGINEEIFAFEIKRNSVYYETYLKTKKCKYVMKSIQKGHKIALKYSGLTDDEFKDNENQLIKLVNQRKKDILIYEIDKKSKTPYQVVKQLDLDLEEIYKTYQSGIYGGEDEEFAREFERVFIEPIAKKVASLMDERNISANKALKIIKNEGGSSNLNSLGEKALKQKIFNKRRGIIRSNINKIKQIAADDDFKPDLGLSNQDYKIWKNCKILENYFYRSVSIDFFNLPDMASC